MKKSRSRPEHGDDRSRLRGAALRMLARREHSAAELGRKLSGGSAPEGLAAEVIGELAAERLQSDERFAESFAAGRISRGCGPLRVRYELDQRGIDTALIERCMAAAEVDWQALARSVRTKRFGEALPASAAERARQARFLQYRGFTAEQIRRALEDVD